MRAVNLIPTDVRRAGPGVQMGGLGPGYAVLALLGVALLLVTVYVLTSNTIADRQAKLATLQTQVTQEQALAGQLTPYATYTKLAQTRVSTVRQIAESRFDWHSALSDLSRVVPANTSLQSLLATVGSGAAVTGPGGSIGGSGSTSTLRADIPAPAFQLSGCTASHDDVARLMSRLRSINGVQRVTLADSVKPSVSSSATAAPSASTSATGACPPSATNFDVVVFFEPLAGASPAVAGGAVAPGSTAAVASTAASAGSSSSTTTATTTTQAISNPPASGSSK